MSSSEAMQRQLETVLAREITGFKALLACDQLTAGASQETFRILIDTRQGEQQFALRRSPTSTSDELIPGQMPLDTEARLLQLANEAGIPVPGLVYVLTPADELGQGYFMQWLEGETLGQRIVRSEALAEVRPLLARQCGEALARIHAIEVDEALTRMLPTTTPEALVHESWDSYKALNLPQPMIDFTARWLLQNLPTGARQTLVHGDFRNGNLMIDETGIRAVLDWELAQIGDPVRDLGWLCVNSWRFGQAELPVGGFGVIEDMLEGYRTVSGIDIDRDDLTFWLVFGSFWWSIATLSMALTWRTGETPSLERPVIGRRSSEGQMDCVNLLIPGKFQHLADRPLDQGHQLPMPAELLEGVRKFLKEDVAANQQGRSAFLAKVAANSLGIAQRELLHGQALAQREEERLQKLLGEGDLEQLRWQLVHALRADLPLDTPGLDEHLRETVAGQLAIDQPFYSALHPTA